MTHRQAFHTSLLALLLSVLPLFAAHAAPGDAADSKEAISLYKQGRRLLSRRKHEQALEALDKSIALLPSPNTGLLRAQALRELGRLGEAMEAYAQVMDDAAARLRAGEKRYKKTLEEAGRHSAVLRTQVGELSVSVLDAPEGTTLSLAERQLTPNTDGEQLVAELWLAAGSVTVEARAPDGTMVSESVEITAGASASVELQFPKAEPDPVADAASLPAAPDEDGDGGPFPAPPVTAWIAGGVGVVGFALFAGFGAASASTAGDLDPCAPRCPLDMREDADAGSRNQTIANVGLVVGITGVAAFGTIWLVSALMDDGNEAPDEVALGLGPGALTVVGRF